MERALREAFIGSIRMPGMPNYPTHARWGRGGAVLAAIAVGALVYTQFEAVVLSVGAAGGAAIATFVGAIFPDIDHHASVPRQKAVRALQGLVVAAVAAAGALRFETIVEASETVLTQLGTGVPPTAVAVGGIGVATVVLVGAVDPTIGLVTRRHRGWTHSVAVTFGLAAVLAGGAVALTLELSPAEQVSSVAVVGAFYAGILIHLGLDGEIV